MMGAVFLLVSIHLAWAGLAFCLKKIKIKNEINVISVILAVSYQLLMSDIKLV